MKAAVVKPAFGGAGEPTADLYRRDGGGQKRPTIGTSCFACRQCRGQCRRGRVVDRADMGIVEVETVDQGAVDQGRPGRRQGRATGQTMRVRAAAECGGTLEDRSGEFEFRGRQRDAQADSVATMIGGRGVGPVDRGTTTMVRRARFNALAVSTTAGRVLRSIPRVGSRSAHHTSPRRTVADVATGGFTPQARPPTCHPIPPSRPRAVRPPRPPEQLGGAGRSRRPPEPGPAPAGAERMHYVPASAPAA